MGLWACVISWARGLLGSHPKVVRRYPFSSSRESGSSEPHVSVGYRVAPVGASPQDRSSSDEVVVCLDSLVMRLTRKTDLGIAHEVTVVVPRAEITKRYQAGHLVEEVIAYSSITIAHSPRFPPGGTSQSLREGERR